MVSPVEGKREEVIKVEVVEERVWNWKEGVREKTKRMEKEKEKDETKKLKKKRGCKS